MKVREAIRDDRAAAVMAECAYITRLGAAGFRVLGVGYSEKGDYYTGVVLVGEEKRKFIIACNESETEVLVIDIGRSMKG